MFMLYCESDALSVYGANAMVASRHIRFQMQLKLTVTQKAGEYSQMTFNPHPKRYYSFTFLISFLITYVRKGADRDLNSLPSPILTTLIKPKLKVVSKKNTRLFVIKFSSVWMWRAYVQCYVARRDV